MTTKQVITVTLNPSLDRTLVTHHLAIGYHNQVADTTRLHPAGRGVNIARALTRLEIRTHAVIVLGDDATGSAYRALLAQEALPATFVTCPGTTRSNVTILDTGTGQETHIIEKSTGLTQAEVDRVADAVHARAGEGDFVIFAGSLQDGSPADSYAQIMRRVRENGAMIVLSVTSESTAQGIEAGPDLLATTQVELEGYFNYPVRVQEDVLYAGRSLLEKGIREVLVVQADGHATLIAQDGAWTLTYDEETLGTHSGIKEAVLAGYVAGRAQGLPVNEALELGGAAAVYTAGQLGSEFGTREDVDALSDAVDVSPEES